MKKSAVVNLKDLNVEGNVIDVASKGNAIISEIVSKLLLRAQNTYDKDFLTWNNKSVSSDGNEYDMALSFFSVNTLSNKHKLKRLIRELKRILKNKGKLIMWDVYTKGTELSIMLDMKVLVDEGDIRSVKYNVFFNPLRPKFADVINVLERNGFEVSSKINGNVYCIEAVNNKEGIR